MSEPYLGEIRAFAFPFAPQGWLSCAGQLLAINQYSALFSLLGVFYGGNGTTTFGVPDLRGRTVMGAGQGPGLSPRPLGEVAGLEQVTLSAQQMPTHTHAVAASSTADAKTPNDTVPAYTAGGASYGAGTPDLAMSARMLASAGGSQPHGNLPPYLVLNYCIAVVGVFPPRD